MYTLVRSNNLFQLVVAEGPQFVAAMGIAELAYHFHSFSLECISFLATWWLLSYGRKWLRG